jgi:hypothetical protein
MLHRPHSVIAGLLVALVVGACAPPYRTSNRQEVKADGMSVVITGARSEAEARPLAEDYCRTHGGEAYFKGIMQYRARRETSKVAAFECHDSP